MKNSSLQLDFYYFTKVNVEVNEQFKQTADMTKAGNMPDVEIQFGQAKTDNHKWQVSLAVKNLPDGIASEPYKYMINVVGFISVEKSVPEDAMMKLVAVNAPALLYPAVREMLHNMASRGPVPGRHLPSVMFTDLQIIMKHKEGTAKQGNTRKMNRRTVA